MSYPYINIAGFVGRDPETKDVNGSTVTNFTVGQATFSNGTKGVIWFKCNAWGKDGDYLAAYLKKGTAIAVGGSFSVFNYQNKEGKEQSVYQVKVDSYFISKSADDRESKHKAFDPLEVKFEGFSDEELPF
jgi:single-strand DNA-binding protein